MNRANSGVNLAVLRGHNAALVLDLLRTAGDEGISRLELAERTGLTPQGVSKITARLREQGLVTDTGRRASTGGKPRTVLRLVPDAGHAVGLHLDRDELTAVLVDLAGTVVAERRSPLAFGAGGDAVVEAAASEVEALLADADADGGDADTDAGGGDADAGRGDADAGEPDRRGVREPDAQDPGAQDLVHPEPPTSRVLGVGVALPGPLDHSSGVLHRVTGFPEWDGFPLRDALAERLGLPVVVDKDTNAAALGLALAGSGDAFAYLHLGTGLGAGLVLGGAPYRGPHTGAGEFGHQVIQLDGPLCSCGNRGCIEALCLAAVAAGSFDEAARVLGEGAANMVGLLDIDLVLLGGRTVAAAEERFVEGVRAVLGERARRGGTVEVPVLRAPGAATAVVEGAAQLVLAPLFGRAHGHFPANRNDRNLS
ncbi:MULTISPECIES: ROK family transcriptional regulator [unclassified Streptomyces]|uniref:ROK family transcriptional regulator n=1 Tax=unclassified Streptomyces TaxID=2593676 RepID=UPI002DDB7C5E|nr:ROK family transcriptional regulator [Streptomyces sp. NBC_01445]WSE07009.1 ROK family transcriptional regulator [Streptomyces sp. NBC_01445]